MHLGFRIRLTAALLGFAVVSCQATAAQARPERFWLAGRYDGNRIIVYFDAVHFKGTVPATAKQITEPISNDFFMPVELPPSYVSRFLNAPNLEHFALGDKYDLLLDDRRVATVTLTTLVGTEADEEVGNDSYIGALATFDSKDDIMFMTNSIYVARRHYEPPRKSKANSNPDAVYAGLQSDPVRFDIQEQILALMSAHPKMKADHPAQPQKQKLVPTFAVQAFHLANGSLRYYARASWNRVGEKANEVRHSYGFGAWISPTPTLHILALEESTGGYGSFSNLVPNLLNVVDLGGGKSGIIVLRFWADSNSTDLFEYADGLAVSKMHVLNSISAGE